MFHTSKEIWRKKRGMTSGGTEFYRWQNMLYHEEAGDKLLGKVAQHSVQTSSRKRRFCKIDMVSQKRNTNNRRSMQSLFRHADALPCGVVWCSAVAGGLLARGLFFGRLGAVARNCLQTRDTHQSALIIQSR